MSLTLTIAGANKTTKFLLPSNDGEVHASLMAGSRSSLQLKVYDRDGVAGFRPSIDDTLTLTSGVTDVFSGRIDDIEDAALTDWDTGVISTLTVSDWHALLDQITYSGAFNAGTSLRTVLSSFLADKAGALGITLSAGAMGSLPNGPLMTATVSFSRSTGTDVLNQLQALTGYIWRISTAKVLTMTEPGYASSGISLSDTSGNVLGHVTWRKSRNLAYANISYVNIGPSAIVEKSGVKAVTGDAIVGDGAAAYWDLAFDTVADATSGFIVCRGYVTEGGVTKTLGLYPAGGTDYAYDPATNRLYRSAGVLGVGVVVDFLYGVQFPVEISYEDTVESAAHGPYEGLPIDLPDTTDYAEGVAYAVAVTRRRIEAQQIVTLTQNAGICYPGQTIALSFAERAVSGTYLITAVDMETQEDGTLAWTVTAVGGLELTETWLDYYRGIASGGGGSSSASISGISVLTSGVFGSGTVGKLAAWATSTTLTDSHTAADVILSSGSYADPAWITSLAATKLTGTINDARLSANVPLLNAANTFTNVGMTTFGGSMTLGAGGGLFLSNGGLLYPAGANDVWLSVSANEFSFNAGGGQNDFDVRATSTGQKVRLYIAQDGSSGGFQAIGMGSGSFNVYGNGSSSGAGLVLNGASAANQWEITPAGLFRPGADNTYSIGSSSRQVADLWAAGNVGTGSYASLTTGWRVTGAGAADFRNLYTDELHAKALIADLEQALAGGQIVSKSVAILAAAFTAPAAAGTTTLTVEDLPGASAMAVFQTNDYVALRSFARAAGGLTIGDCVGVVTGYTNNGNGTQSWTFTRASGGSAGTMTASTVVPAKSIVLDYGVSGNGYYEVNAIDGTYGVNSPYAQVVTWTTSPVAANRSVRARYGNLLGITSSAEYGLFAGKSYSGKQYLLASDTNFELHGIDLKLYDGATNTVRINPTVPSFAMGSTLPTAYGTGTGIWMGKDTVYKFRVGDPSGNRLAWDNTDLTVVSANLTIDSTGVHLVPDVTGSAYVAGNAYGFTVTSGALGQSGYDNSSGRGIYTSASWTGAAVAKAIDIFATADYRGVNLGYVNCHADESGCRVDIVANPTGGGGTSVLNLQATDLKVAARQTMSTGSYVYPGTVSGLSSYQTTYYLASHSSYGCYTNGGFKAEGDITSGGAFYATTKLSFAPDSDTFIDANASNRLRFVVGNTDGFFIDTAQLFPGIDITYHLGIGSFKWIDVYAANGTINTSDARQKHSIAPTIYGPDFLRALRPVDYEWNNPKLGASRYQGFIAQDVAAVAPQFGGLYRDEDGIANGLNYPTFIAPLVAGWQDHDARIAALESRLFLGVA